jgi:hypothetical protein
MITALLRQDRIWERLPKWLLVTLTSVLVVCGIRAMSYLQAVRAGEGADAHALPLIVLAVWVPLGLFLAYAGTLPRAAQLSLALPLTARRLWLTHLAALLLACALVLLLAGAVIALIDLGLNRWLDYGEIGPPPGLLAMLPQMFGGTALASVVLLTWRPSLHRLTLRHEYAILAAATLLGVLALLLLIVGRSAAWSLLPLGIAGAVIVTVSCTLPASLRLAPAAGLPIPDAAALAHAAQPGRATGRPVWWLVTRIFYGDMKLLLLLPLFAIYGMVLSSLVSALTGDSDAGLLNLPLSWYLLLSVVPSFVRRLPQLDPLPVARRLVFTLMMLPAAGLLAAGYLGATVAAGMIHLDRDRILFEDHDSHHAVLVPLEFFEIAWDGRPAELTAPWGESHPARTIPISPLLRPVLYKPYTAPDGSTRRYVAWQLSRAVAAVYGEHLAPEEIEARYLVTDSAGGVTLRHGRLPLQGEHPGWRPVGADSTVPLVLVLMLAPGLLVLALILSLHRAGISERRRKLIMIAALVVIMGLQISQIGLAMADLWDPAAATAFVAILARRLAGILPTGSFGLWLGAALLLAGPYWLAASRFRRLEAIPPRDVDAVS